MRHPRREAGLPVVDRANTAVGDVGRTPASQEAHSHQLSASIPPGRATLPVSPSLPALMLGARQRPTLPPSSPRSARRGAETSVHLNAGHGEQGALTGALALNQDSLPTPGWPTSAPHSGDSWPLSAQRAWGLPEHVRCAAQQSLRPGHQTCGAAAQRLQ